jgi:hypothetical protein
MPITMEGGVMCVQYRKDSDGRLDLLGFGELFYLERLPSPLKAYLVLSLRAPASEPAEQAIELHFSRPDGSALGGMRCDIRFELPPGSRVQHANPGINLAGPLFDSEGEHTIEVRAAGATIGRMTFGLYKLP